MNVVNIIDVLVAILMVIGTLSSLGTIAKLNGLRDGAIYISRYNRYIMTPTQKKVNFGLGVAFLGLFVLIDMNVSFVVSAICWLAVYGYTAAGSYFDQD